MKRIVSIFICLLLTGSVFGEQVILAANFGMEGEATAPEPRLLSPTSERIVLAGKNSLTFKWSPFEGRLYERVYYDDSEGRFV